MEGGCSIPVFGYAQMEQDGQIEFTGGISSLDGKQLIKRTMYGSGEELGTSLAEEILASGGKKVLDDIKSAN
jgi:hydroxymethylbilane synthase